MRLFSHPQSAARFISSQAQEQSEQNRRSGLYLAIGNFDGLHIGHQNILKEIVAKARDNNAVSLAFTFEPPPFEYFQTADGGEVKYQRLMTLSDKLRGFAELGVDIVFVARFDLKLQKLDAKEFCENYLRPLSPTQIHIGEDFHYGRNRTGDIHSLRRWCKDYSDSDGDSIWLQSDTAVASKTGSGAMTSVAQVPTYSFANSRISSTRVRQAIKANDFVTAESLLGRPWSYKARVRKGRQLARQWGFNTANMPIWKKLLPLSGVFAVRGSWDFTETLGAIKRPYLGVCNIGTRPTVEGEGNTQKQLEVHFLTDTEVPDLYGRKVCIEFVKKIRDEKKFANVGELQEQIAKDRELAKAVLSS